MCEINLFFFWQTRVLQGADLVGHGLHLPVVVLVQNVVHGAEEVPERKMTGKINNFYWKRSQK